MFEIIPGILEKEWSGVESKIELVLPFAKTIHIDIVDGIFAENKTFLDPAPFAKYTKDIFFELHMMVKNPLQYVKPFADAGFRRFLGHIEQMDDIEEFVVKGQSLGEVCLAIDGPTPLEDIPVALDDLDGLLLMTIKAGFSGQQFMEDFAKKAEEVKARTWIPIEIDGGINDQTIVQAAHFGATRFVSTSFLFKTGEPQGQYNNLLSCLEKAQQPL